MLGPAGRGLPRRGVEFAQLGLDAFQVTAEVGGLLLVVGPLQQLGVAARLAAQGVDLFGPGLPDPGQPGPGVGVSEVRLPDEALGGERRGEPGAALRPGGEPLAGGVGGQRAGLDGVGGGAQDGGEPGAVLRQPGERRGKVDQGVGAGSGHGGGILTVGVRGRKAGAGRGEAPGVVRGFRRGLLGLEARANRVCVGRRAAVRRGL